MTAVVDDSWPIIESTVARLFDDVAPTNADDDVYVALAPSLAELGWGDIESDYPIEACRLLFRNEARVLAQTDSLDRVILAEMSGLLPDKPVGVVLPVVGDGQRPSSTSAEVGGIILGPLPTEGSIAVPLVDAAGDVALTSVDARSLQGERIDTFDRSAHWTLVTGPVTGEAVSVTAEWDRAAAAAQRALATELVTLSDEILRIACDHASERKQFGSIIASFQVIRHDLANAYVQIEGARALLDESWSYGGRMSALAAKIAAARTHRAVSAVAIQVCAAIGVTAEYGLHRYVHRGFQLDGLFGTELELSSVMNRRLFDVNAPAPSLPGAIAG